MRRRIGSTGSGPRLRLPLAAPACGPCLRCMAFARNSHKLTGKHSFPACGAPTKIGRFHGRRRRHNRRAPFQPGERMSTSTRLSSTPPALFGLIGNTPLVEVTRLDTGPCQLFLKLESQNPGGSIKDRIGLSIIEAAEADGRLQPGGTIIEATAGNTGLGLALVGRLKGYRVLLVVPDKMSTEKVLHLKALGAEVRSTRSDVGKGHPEYYQDYAARLAKEIPDAFFADQFNNPANPLAHETSTAPEIWAQTQHDVDAIVVGVGSAGTLTGLTRFFKRVQPELAMVLADPIGSVMAEYSRSGTLGKPGSWAVQIYNAAEALPNLINP